MPSYVSRCLILLRVLLKLVLTEMCLQDTARRHQHAELRKLREEQTQRHTAEQKQFETRRANESEKMKSYLDIKRKEQEVHQDKIRAHYQERNRLLWSRIEAAISEEEAKWRAQQEREQKARDEEARWRKEEEDRRKREEEARQKEADEAKRKQEEVRQKEEAEEKRREAEESEQRARQEQAQQEKLSDEGVIKLRESTGMYDSEGMWHLGLRNLNVSIVYSHSCVTTDVALVQVLKTQIMRAVKGPKPPAPEPPNYTAPPLPPLKKIWSAQRRKITPKIGQLTDDPREIERIVSVCNLPLPRRHC